MQSLSLRIDILHLQRSPETILAALLSYSMFSHQKLTLIYPYLTLYSTWQFDLPLACPFLNFTVLFLIFLLLSFNFQRFFLYFHSFYFYFPWQSFHSTYFILLLFDLPIFSSYFFTSLEISLLFLQTSCKMEQIMYLAASVF